MLADQPNFPDTSTHGDELNRFETCTFATFSPSCCFIQSHKRLNSCLVSRSFTSSSSPEINVKDCNIKINLEKGQIHWPSPSLFLLFPVYSLIEFQVHMKKNITTHMLEPSQWMNNSTYQAPNPPCLCQQTSFPCKFVDFGWPPHQ